MGPIVLSALADILTGFFKCSEPYPLQTFFSFVQLFIGLFIFGEIHRYHHRRVCILNHCSLNFHFVVVDFTTSLFYYLSTPPSNSFSDFLTQHVPSSLFPLYHSNTTYYLIDSLTYALARSHECKITMQRALVTAAYDTSSGSCSCSF